MAPRWLRAPLAPPPATLASSCGGERLWLGTFLTPELAARAYNAMVWRLDSPSGPLNFSNAESHMEADFLTPAFTVVRLTEDLRVRHEYICLSIAQADEADMEGFRAAHQEHVVAELHFYGDIAACCAAD